MPRFTGALYTRPFQQEFLDVQNMCSPYLSLLSLLEEFHALTHAHFSLLSQQQRSDDASYDIT